MTDAMPLARARARTPRTIARPAALPTEDPLSPLDDDARNDLRLRLRIFRDPGSHGLAPAACRALLHGRPGTGKSWIARHVLAKLAETRVELAPRDTAGERAAALAELGAALERGASAGLLLDDLDRFEDDDARALSSWLDRHAHAPLLVMATARDTTGVPGALRDRLERYHVRLPDEGERRRILARLIGRHPGGWSLEEEALASLARRTVAWTRPQLDRLLERAILGKLRAGGERTLRERDVTDLAAAVAREFEYGADPLDRLEAERLDLRPVAEYVEGLLRVAEHEGLGGQKELYGDWRTGGVELSTNANVLGFLRRTLPGLGARLSSIFKSNRARQPAHASAAGPRRLADPSPNGTPNPKTQETSHDRHRPEPS